MFCNLVSATGGAAHR